ncbi:Serine/threonine-protein kinase haspin [Astathelohania contejeani]|uniref:non-specific serine/threonine protein kinase n=1 Tax=Astathelohania contejeani TaxID=164912 RepID=A0ABQ7I2I8_9MICR|nr:Serine/threonine-protein kinase haspin [Thelohania contejeani]
MKTFGRKSKGLINKSFTEARNLFNRIKTKLTDMDTSGQDTTISRTSSEKPKHKILLKNEKANKKRIKTKKLAGREADKIKSLIGSMIWENKRNNMVDISNQVFTIEEFRNKVNESEKKKYNNLTEPSDMIYDNSLTINSTIDNLIFDVNGDLLDMPEFNFLNESFGSFFSCCETQMGENKSNYECIIKDKTKFDSINKNNDSSLVRKFPNYGITNSTEVMPESSPRKQSVLQCIKLINRKPTITNYRNWLKLREIPFNLMPSKNIRKINEATFSEVFMIDKLIYKIIPLDSVSEHCINEDSFYKECAISKIISDEFKSLSFKNFSNHGATCVVDMFIIHGKYTMSYLKAWDKYASNHTVENVRPSIYNDDQRYGVIVMEDGGDDLEQFIFQESWEVYECIRQIVYILYWLENKYKFEHRDLHWGNILIKKSGDKSKILKVNLIDFTISRLEKDGLVLFTDLNSRGWIFEGDEKVDEQFEIYRQMRNVVGDDWKRYEPLTNKLWLGYLINKLEIKTQHLKVKTLLRNMRSWLLSSKNLKELYEKLEKKYFKG